VNAWVRCRWRFGSGAFPDEVGIEGEHTKCLADLFGLFPALAGLPGGLLSGDVEVA